jgi:hypothetical protein
MMLRLLIVLSALATAQDPPKPPDGPPPSLKDRAGTPPTEAEALAKYNALMEKPPQDAAGHWKMAIWCQQNGLRPEAYFHFGKVIGLDPKRDAAWQKLGFRKVDGRWMNDEMVAAETARKKADKEWSAQFKKWHKDIHGGKKQAEARAGIEKVTDPAAVPSIYREFCGGGGADQEIALQILGQVDGPVASKVIATLAVYGKTPGVRRHATELLRGRPAEEFLDMLVSLMKDLLKYEVRPVGGPGSPGILFVEGERFNVQRFYAPPPPPTFNPRPGDTISFDADGFPVVVRTAQSTQALSKTGVPGSKSLVTERDKVTTTTETYSFANAMIEAQRSAMSAQAQLEADVARIDAINEGLRQFNELVMTVAQAATGKSPGRTAKEWRDLLAKGNNPRYARPTRPTGPKPTVDELVPLAYVPDLSAAITFQAQTRFLTQTIVDS